MTELEFNKKLCRIEHNIAKLEEKAIKNEKSHKGLTVNEMHLIECIKNLTKNQEGPTISMIAHELDITRPSTTVAVNKLCSKRYAEKSECMNDGRSVRVKLTHKGERAYSLHKSHTTALMGEFIASLSEPGENDEEKPEENFGVIAACVDKMDDFFDKKLEAVIREEIEF